MKLLVIANLLFAAVNAEYVFQLTKFHEGNIVDMACTFNASTEEGTAIEVRKYKGFLSGNDYTVNVFDCKETSYGSRCFGKVNETACETGYEGEFCEHYGGTDKVIRCHK